MRFLRSIVARPQLAEYTERLSLLGDAGFYFDQYRDTSAPKTAWAKTKSALDFAVGMVTEFNPPYGHGWIEELRDGTMHAIIAFLLA